MIEILSLIKKQNISLYVSNDKIILKGINSIPTNLINEIKTHKEELIVFFENKSLYLDLFNERSSILEFDAGLKRWEAEMTAFDECIYKWLEDNKLSKNMDNISKAVVYLVCAGLKQPFCRSN